MSEYASHSPSPVLFETERLFIREFTRSDIEAVFAYSGDIDNCAFMEWAPESREGVASFIESRLAAQIVNPRKVYDMAACLKDTGELIGSIGLYLNEALDQAEIGWLFNKAYWHMGYASEAARGFIRFGFLALELHRIYAKCDTENTPSFRLMERIGMRREAFFLKDRLAKVRQRESRRSTYVYAMLQKEYLKTLADGSYDPASSK